jgi:peptidoglycan hydrolase-like protein with peptidoglycan-binding domain
LPEDLETVQRMLASWLVSSGLPPLEITRVFDAATATAIAAFQAAQGATPTGTMHVLVDEPAVPLVFGQGEGETLSEACAAARAECKRRAACGPDQVKVERCSCWKGGASTWTCVVQCGCPAPPVA